MNSLGSCWEVATNPLGHYSQAGQFDPRPHSIAGNPVIQSDSSNLSTSLCCCLILERLIDLPMIIIDYAMGINYKFGQRKESTICINTLHKIWESIASWQREQSSGVDVIARPEGNIPRGHQFSFFCKIFTITSALSMRIAHKHTLPPLSLLLAILKVLYFYFFH